MWMPADTAPKNRAFIAKLTWIGEDFPGDIWPQYIGPAFWENELEEFTDTLGQKLSGRKFNDCLSHFTHWAEVPELFSE